MAEIKENDINIELEQDAISAEFECFKGRLVEHLQSLDVSEEVIQAYNIFLDSELQDLSSRVYSYMLEIRKDLSRAVDSNLDMDQSKYLLEKMQSIIKLLNVSLKINNFVNE